MHFILYWRHGSSNIVEGETIDQAFAAAGYGHGTIGALDFYETGNTPSYTWVDNVKRWVRSPEAETKVETELDILLRERRSLLVQLANVSDRIREQVTTWQGLAECDMIVEAIAKWREQEKERTGVLPSVMDGKAAIDSYRASIKEM